MKLIHNSWEFFFPF